MIRKLVLSAFGALLLFGAESATATPAEAAIRCVAVAERINGARVPGTRTVVERRREARACNIALRICEDKLQEARYYRGRPMPFAQCAVVRVRHVGYSGPRYRPYPPPHAGPGYCNYSACAHRYRSFRASDCTFQPYHGPRRHCAL